MSDHILQVGNITFERPAPRVIRVVKAKERVKSRDEYVRDHEIALLKLLAPKYPEIVRELVNLAVAK